MNYKEQIELALQQNQLEELETLFQEVKASQDETEKFQVAEYLESVGYYSLAEELYLDLAAAYPDLYINLASMAAEDGRLEEAYAFLEEIPEESPHYLAALMGKAELYQLEGLPDVAKEKLEQALALSPQPLIIFGLAEVQFELGDYQGAIKQYAKLDYQEIYEQTGVSTYQRIGLAYAHLGKFEAAMEFLEKALELDYSDELLLELALLNMEGGHYQKATIYFKQLHALNPQYEGYEYAYATALHEENQVKEALEILKAGLKKNPFDSRLKLLASQYSYELHDAEVAESYLLSAREDGDEDEEVALRLSTLYLEQERYEDLIELGQEDWDSLLTKWNIARAYQAEERLEEAEKGYQDLLADLKENPEFLESYIGLLRELGKRAEAREWAKSYLQLVPDDLAMQDFIAQDEDDFYH